MTIKQDLIDYYSNLLIIQYHEKPKAKATIELLINALLADVIIFDVRDAFFIDTAVGVQLDIIGKIVGVNRFFSVFRYETERFFAFTNYTLDPPTALQAGMALYSDYLTKEGFSLTYDDLSDSQNRLDDDQFRVMIKLKIIQNSIDHSQKSIDESLFEIFGTDIIMTTRNKMDIDYFVVYDYFPLVKVISQKKLFPKPMGVLLNYAIKSDDYFGFAEYGSYSATKRGFDTYSDETEGKCLEYSKLTSIGV